MLADRVRMSMQSGGNLPGPPKIIEGDKDLGYYGITLPTELLFGGTLSTMVGATAGTAINSDSSWLKVSYEGKVLYISQKPQRHTISWDFLNGKDLIFGKEIEHEGVQYKVRVLTGGTIDRNIPITTHSEWDKIMYKLHKDTGGEWESFTDTDLVLNGEGGLGRTSWVQESPSIYAAYNRGYAGITHIYNYDRNVASKNVSWRPVLEVIE